MINPKAGDVVYIYTSIHEIEAEVIEWGIEKWGLFWVVCKDESKTFTVNIADISMFYIVPNGNDKYKIVNKNDEKSEDRIIDATRLPLGYQLVKNKIGENGSIEKESRQVIVTRRLLKQGKAVTDEGRTEDSKLSIHPVERAKEQLEQQKVSNQSVRHSVQEHMKRKDLIEPKDNYGLPSFKKRS